MPPEDRRLGRGIGDLLKINRPAPGEGPLPAPPPPAPPAPAAAPAAVPAGSQVLQLALDAVVPNPHQPRKHFSVDALNELARSIRQSGILQPVVVRRHGDGYELVAGERRWRAARMAGLTTVPAVVREIGNDRMLEAALVENVQRADLNPLEKAQAYQKLMDQFGYTQQALSDRLGHDRSTVANTLRLLELPPPVKDALVKGTVTMGHARALLSFRDDPMREAVCRRIEAEGLSVRAVEQMAARGLAEDAPKPEKPAKLKSADVKALEDQLRQALGTKVEIHSGRGRKGKVVIEYYSIDDFNRLFRRLLK